MLALGIQLLTCVVTNHPMGGRYFVDHYANTFQWSVEGAVNGQCDLTRTFTDA